MPKKANAVFPHMFHSNYRKIYDEVHLSNQKCSALRVSLKSYEASKLRLAKTLTQSMLEWKPGSFKHYFTTANCKLFCRKTQLKLICYVGVKRLLSMFFCRLLCVFVFLHEFVGLFVTYILNSCT